MLGAPIAIALAVSQRNSAKGPEVLVRTYVDHLAAGRAGAASELVAPVAKAGAALDPALLQDAVLGAARERLVVEDVSASYDLEETPVGGESSVTVHYTLKGSANRVDLAVRRLPNTWGLLTHWEIVGDLAVPVAVETNVPALLVARIGAASVPVSGPSVNGFPQQRVMLYPGVYPVTGVDSRWLRAAKDIAVDDNRTAYISNASPTGQLWYEATDALWDKVRADAAKQVDACAAAGPRMPATRCPPEMVHRQDWGTLRVTQQPEIEQVGAFQSDYRADGETLPTLRFTSGLGELSYSGSGMVDRGVEDFRVDGGIYLSQDGDSARIELWSSLSGPGR